MTVSTQTTVHAYVGDGVQTEWPILFPFFAPEDVKAIRTATDGVDTLLEYGSAYVVTPLELGGTCTCPLASGERLTLYLELELQQSIDLSNTGILAPEILERGLDRLTLIAQQQAEAIGRCVQVGRVSDISASDLLSSIDACAAQCVSGAQSALTSAAAASEASRTALACAATLSLPLTGAADAGRGLVAGGEGGWQLGGTAAGRDVGTEPGQVPTNADIPALRWYRPQTIVGGALPYLGIGGLEYIDAPDIQIPVHTAPDSAFGTASASSEYTASYTNYAWNAVRGDGWKTANSYNEIWMSAGDSPQWWTYTFSSPRNLRGVTIAFPNYPTYVTYGPKDFTIECDGVVVCTATGVSWSILEEKTFMFDTWAGGVSELKITITAGNGGPYIVIGNVAPLFGRAAALVPGVAEGEVCVAAGTEMALAEGGRLVTYTVPSDLTAALPVSDGIQYVLVGPDGLSIEAAPAAYDHATGMWSDGVVRHIVAWIEVSGGLPVQFMACPWGSHTTLDPVGTVLPNPYIYLDVVAVQEGTVCPVVENEITGVDINGGPVRVWRLA